MNLSTDDQGWHVLHLFYNIDYLQWNLYSSKEKSDYKDNFYQLIQSIRSEEQTQLLVFSMLSSKSDLGIMILTKDLIKINAFEKQLNLSLGPSVLLLSYSYLSLTELSEYTTTKEMYSKQLIKEENVSEGSQEFNDKIQEFSDRMEKYNNDRLYPNMPDWEVFCFYPMSKRRSDKNNWYNLDFETRRELMQGHAKVGRSYAGKIRQLITGSTGLDEYEWGVTLFSHSTHEIKKIVYEMRFDKVSSLYAEFGDFYIGIQLSAEKVFKQLSL